jgi:hypothetical protein
MNLKVACLAVLLLALSAIPCWAQGWTYDNGPINGTTDAWDINFGYMVSDSFDSEGTNVTALTFAVWEFPGDTMSSVQWSITSSPFGVPPNARGSSVTYGSGTASGNNLTDKFISTNQFGYDIDLISATISAGGLISGSLYWLNLSNAAVPSGEPVFWDENSGTGCDSPGCPSHAYQNTVGTIASEAFTIGGCEGCGCLSDKSGCTLGQGGAPEPGSIVLFGSGVLCLAGLLRRRLNL